LRACDRTAHLQLWAAKLWSVTEETQLAACSSGQHARSLSCSTTLLCIHASGVLPNWPHRHQQQCCRPGRPGGQAGQGDLPARVRSVARFGAQLKQPDGPRAASGARASVNRLVRCRTVPSPPSVTQKSTSAAHDSLARRGTRLLTAHREQTCRQPAPSRLSFTVQLPRGRAQAAGRHMKYFQGRASDTFWSATALSSHMPCRVCITNGGTSGRACLVGVEGVILRELGPSDRPLHQDAQPPRLQPARDSPGWHTAGTLTASNWHSYARNCMRCRHLFAATPGESAAEPAPGCLDKGPTAWAHAGER